MLRNFSIKASNGSLDRKCCSRQHNTHRSYYKTKSIENYINIDKAIDLNDSVDDTTLMQQIVDTINKVDGQEDEKRSIGTDCHWFRGFGWNW